MGQPRRLATAGGGREWPPAARPAPSVRPADRGPGVTGQPAGGRAGSEALGLGAARRRSSGGLEAKRPIESIPSDTDIGLRDRAALVRRRSAVLNDTFARVEVVVGMAVEDSIPSGPKRWSVRLHQKGGKGHTMPARRRLQEALGAYLSDVPLSADKKHPLFPTAPGRGRPLRMAETKSEYESVRMNRHAAYRMVKRKAKKAEVLIPIGNHSFRGTGTTNYLKNGGTLAADRDPGGGPEDGRPRRPADDEAVRPHGRGGQPGRD